MKELFQNNSGFNTVEINLDCLAGNLTLYYQLSDNPVQNIWQSIHINKKDYIMSLPVNAPTDYIISLVNEICPKYNLSGLTEHFTDDDLNRIHSTMADLSKVNNTKDLDTLNKCIHILESKLRNKYVQYNSNITFYSNIDERIPIKEEYKLWLEPNPKWGDLILGYATLGKDWIDISVDNDDPKELAIQSNITSETCMVFRTEYNYPKATETLFYRYAKNVAEVPLNNLNAMSLGRYFLGKLIIDDTLLNYHSNVGDWYIPNHICKLNWNKNIIGPNVKIKSLRFFNDHKYHEMSIDHAQIRPII